MRRFHSTWPWFLLVAGFLVLTYYVAGYDLTTGHGLPLHSSRRYDPFGSSALRELVEYRGAATRYLERPVPPPESDATLIMILPVPLAPADAEDSADDGPGNFGRRRLNRLRDWVADGNRVILLGRLLPGHMDSLAATVAAPGDAAQAVELESWQARGDYAKALEAPGVTVPLAEKPEASLFLARPSRVVVPEGARIAAGDEDNALAVTTAVGRGSITVIADPTPALNFALPREDNAEFLLSLLGGGAVYFDEYSLGLGQDDSTLDWIRRHGLVPLLLQAILVMYLLARSTDSVYEKAEQPAEPDQPPAGEQIRILAGLYDRTLSDHELNRKRQQYADRMNPPRNPRAGKSS